LKLPYEIMLELQNGIKDDDADIIFAMSITIL